MIIILIIYSNEPWDFHKSKIEGNTGFYFVRSNNNTIKLWEAAFAAAPRYPRLDDQAVFWKVIRSSFDPPVLPLGIVIVINDYN